MSHLFRDLERETLSVAFALTESTVSDVGVWLILKLRLELDEEEEVREILTSRSLLLEEYSDEGADSRSWEVIDILF